MIFILGSSFGFGKAQSEEESEAALWDMLGLGGGPWSWKDWHVKLLVVIQHQHFGVMLDSYCATLDKL